MSRAEEIEQAINQLPPDDWIIERDNELWDAQIERDAASEKLDELFGEAIDASQVWPQPLIR